MNKFLLKPYMELMRLHSPTGFLLLLWPCLWALALACGKNLNLWYFFLFTIGAIFMRGAGCIINDLVDIEFDKKVTRTKNRPLAAGILTKKQALIHLFILLSFSLLILFQMNQLTIYIGFFSILPIIIYPFMKRLTFFPQVFLGLTFNLGIFMAYSAIENQITIAPFFLYIGCIFWTIGYDIIYAFQDIKDDKAAGVKSMAIYLGQQTKYFVNMFYRIFTIMTILAGIFSAVGPLFYFGMFFIYLILNWQIETIILDDPKDCFNKFKSNNIVGFLILVLIICANFLR